MKIALIPNLPGALRRTTPWIDISLGALRRAVEAWKRRRDERAVCEALRRLDHATLRDLGYEDHRALLRDTLFTRTR